MTARSQAHGRDRRRRLVALGAASLTAVALSGGDGSLVAKPSFAPTSAAASVLVRSPPAERRARGREPRDGGARDRDSADRLAPGGGRRGARRILSGADAASFRRLEAALGGRSGLAVSALGLGQATQRMGSLRSGVAWSTSKVPVAMAVIAAGAGQAHQDDLARALTESDNAAALRLWATLGDGPTAARAATEQLRAAGDRHTIIESRELRAGYTPFGQTRWALSDQTRFTAGLRCTSAGPQVLELLGHVIAGQRWGLGAVDPAAQFKGGWGPGSRPGVQGGDLDRQLGIVTAAGRTLAVTIATRPADGSHTTGAHNLTRIARWLAAHAEVRGVPAQAAC